MFPNAATSKSDQSGEDGLEERDQPRAQRVEVAVRVVRRWRKEPHEGVKARWRDPGRGTLHPRRCESPRAEHVERVFVRHRNAGRSAQPEEAAQMAEA